MSIPSYAIGVKPECRCGSEMKFLMDDKVKEIWDCPRCHRLLCRSKEHPELGEWYVPEDK